MQGSVYVHPMISCVFCISLGAGVVGNSIRLGVKMMRDEGRLKTGMGVMCLAGLLLNGFFNPRITSTCQILNFL